MTRKEWMKKRGFKMVMDPSRMGFPADFSPNAEYQFMREEWSEPTFCRLTDFHPLANMIGLQYRALVTASAS